MSLIARILKSKVGETIRQVGGLVDKFHLSGEEKQKFKLEMEGLLQKRDSEIEETIRAELQAKERILVAELTQGDNYTKRARPTVVYAGLLFTFINYVLVPIISEIIGTRIPPFDLPTAFWAGWSGIVATWSIGRSVEKRGIRTQLTRMITGQAKSQSNLLDI